MPPTTSWDLKTMVLRFMAAYKLSSPSGALHPVLTSIKEAGVPPAPRCYNSKQQSFESRTNNGATGHLVCQPPIAVSHCEVPSKGDVANPCPQPGSEDSVS
ncbi:unnamed protein product [Schistosoma curassoni]|uniref:Uncharacterized protein n=1 Tax=Schistosoma curassoni TaxID=6186 RepID=A0A183JH60_9TREM|nr:unnamed protein product [Schistosoma curassoni]